MSIRIGNAIIANAGGSGGSGGTANINTDNVTIVKGAENKISAVGVKTKSDTVMINWEGTYVEWMLGRADGTISDDWYCYITDDIVEGEVSGGINFTPIAPLAFETTTVEGLYNVSYDKETREATTDKYSFILNNYSGDISYIASGATIGKDGSLICENYIDFPYQFGDILIISEFSSNCKIMFGYYNESNSFVPVTCTHSDNSNRLVIDTFRYYDTDYIHMPHLDLHSVNSTVKCANYECAYQLFKDENETFTYSYQKDTNVMQQSIIQTQYNSMVSRVNVVRLNIPWTTIVPIVYSGNGTILNKFNSIDEITALPIVELKESSTGTVLVDNSFGLSYNDLNNKPKVNGIEIKGDISISSLNVQDALTTKGPLKISKAGEWKAFNGQYNEPTRQFELGNAYCSTPSEYTSWDLSTISTYVSDKEVKPTAGVIMPFYKNSTYVPYSNNIAYLNYCTCFIGVWNGETFRPAYTLMPTKSISATSMIRTVNSISGTVNCDFRLNSGEQSTISKVTGYEDGLAPHPCIFIGYDNGAYIFKGTDGHISSRELRQYIPSKTDTEVLNECNAIWMIGTKDCYNIGDGPASKLVQGDITEQLLMGKLDGTTFPAILPDNENYYTELSLNIDNETIKLNGDNQLYATVDTSALQNKITSVESTATTTQSQVTSLTTRVTSLESQLSGVESLLTQILGA